MNYKLKLLGLERDLPLVKTKEGLSLAGFNPVGDMQLLTKAAKKLAKIVLENKIDYDLVLTTELKGLPIAQEVARNLKCDYVCLRKENKCYLANAKCIEGGSITSGKSKYYISQLDLEKLKNKKLLFVDDVFSTGSTFKSITEFANQENFALTGCLCILREGNQELNFSFNGVPIYCCGCLPLP